ncbi:GspE/PulE family protein, partial [Thermodesulfovibrionales bacterium]|nr:GspE/PulE family protein [Thermodesulfovibrionales bacterium]
MDCFKEQGMLGNVLVEKRIINEGQLSEALKVQTKNKEPLGQILVKLGYCLEEDIAHIIAEIYELPYVELEEIEISSAVIQSIPANLAFRHNVIPVKIEENTLYLACTQPLSPQVISNLQRLTNKKIAFYIGVNSAISSLLKKYYMAGRTPSEETLVENVADQSVSNVLKNCLSEAIRQRTSDIHFETQDTKVRVRFRIDGILNEREPLSKELALPLISRIKILSGLDIAEKRAPQDGSFVFEDMGESLDVRVSILPNVQGEKAVLRLLPSKRKIITLESLGMEKDTLEEFSSLIKRPHGLVLITGPTGSGKSTTLYAALLLIRSAGVNITTIEDPVEYHIEGITQTQVDHANKITFPKALRSILRQDPDIIMVGEIRDKETADIALRAALTGHLVFSTLHTNDAPSALTRLLDMGCQPYLVSSTVCGVLAQRLVRLNCKFCQVPCLAQDELEKLGLNTERNDVSDGVKDIEAEKMWFRGQGCRRCQKTGFKGRSGIFELLKVNDFIQKEIVRGSFTDKIKEVAVAGGMRTLRQAAFSKVEQG